jgi:hypothetical protein
MEVRRTDLDHEVEKFIELRHRALLFSLSV